MLQLATPLGLIAGTALAAPILIHLIRRPLRVVRLGNLDFLESSRRRVRSLRWQDTLLLLLRCALLCALSLVLAGIYWEPQQPPPVRWIFLVPSGTFDAAVREEWNQRRRDGFEEHRLEADFPAAGQITMSEEARGKNGAMKGPIDAWSLMRELDARLPQGSRVEIFGPPLASYFRGTRPTTRRVEISWRATDFASAQDPATRNAPPEIRAAVFAAPDRTDDANYVGGMLHAVGAKLDSESPDWIFQLGDITLPPSLAARAAAGAHVITDADNTEQSVSVSRSFAAGPTRVHLRQRTPAGAGAVLLSDSTGEPLATRDRSANGDHWKFALRFHPDWSDWPITSAFPAWWKSQLLPPDVSRSLITAEQATPHFDGRSGVPTSEVPSLIRHDLRWTLWCIAVVLFALERYLSATRRRVPAAA